MNIQMFTSRRCLLSFLHFVLSITILNATTMQPHKLDSIRLNCGERATKTNSPDNRSWDTDLLSNFTAQNTLNTTYTSTALEQNHAARVPYLTARIFNSTFTYTFPVSTGPKFLRLFFYPATYSGLNKTTSYFSVTAAHNYTLLTNFNAFLNLEPQQYTLTKEFIINVNEDEILNVTFSPSPNSLAFINGIEVVPIPQNLWRDEVIPFVGRGMNFTMDNYTILEKFYRLNVGGNNVDDREKFGTFRSWVMDESNVQGYHGLEPRVDNVRINYTSDYPDYTAPDEVYSSSRTTGDDVGNRNITWTFKVDSGFPYLLRLYFCEYNPAVNSVNQRVFDIFINNKIAQREADVIEWSGGPRNPVYKDYVVYILNPDGKTPKADLLLAMRPDNGDKYSTILNGLEIFKINQSDGNLGVPSPAIVSPPPNQGKGVQRERSRPSSKLFAGIGGAVGGIILFSVIGFLIFWRHRRREKGLGSSDSKTFWHPLSYASKSTKSNPSTLPSVKCRHFPIEEIKSATGNFDDNFVIGTGGFGRVYKGYIENGAITVAIKRSNPSSRQGAHEFRTEIEMLSNLRHLHLVSLVGYCDDDGEMILVYDYMAQGTLRSHLYTGENPPLSWKQRLQICIGAARGLHYLHTGAKRLIIHRDVKSTNILLDDKWVAKVSDFGLSKMGPSDPSISHISTAVKGSHGYVDPEYYRRQQLTDKSDVYSFGVVLFEALCGRPAIIQQLPKEQVNLAEWAQNNFKNGTLDQIIDENLRDEIAPESLKKFGEVAYSCVKEQGIDRPTMSDVVWNLEFVLQLQEAGDKLGQKIDELPSDDPNHLLHWEGMSSMDNEEVFSESVQMATKSKSSGTSNNNSSSDRLLPSGSVFSEIMNPNAR